jgi:pilus assembly protein Flp/PilA
MDLLSDDRVRRSEGGDELTQTRRTNMLQYDFLATWLRARFGDSERGASLVEYALLVALIAVVCIAAVTILGKNASNKFNSVGNSISG